MHLFIFLFNRQYRSPVFAVLLYVEHYASFLFSVFVRFFLFSFRILMLMLGGSVMKFHSSATSVSYCLYYLVCAMSHSRRASSVLLLNLLLSSFGAVMLTQFC